MSVLDQLIAELSARRKEGTASGTPSAPYYSGPGGLFGVSGLERDVISTSTTPRGLAGRLPSRGSTSMYPRFPYLHSFSAPSGSNPDGVCDDPKTAGAGAVCVQTADFGRYSFQTRELEANRIGQRIDRGEFQDLRLVNSPIRDFSGAGITTPNVGGNPGLQQEVMLRMLEVGISFQNQLTRQLYLGNPANNTAGGGYKEFPGLDILIGTNKVDAITGATCPALNSDIKNFNCQLVTAFAPNDIVHVLTTMMRILESRAEQTNLVPASWAIVMRQELWWEITALWPCAYLTYRCGLRASDGSQVLGVSANDQVAMRDSMRNGMYLLVDGKQYPVIIDDGITEDTSTTNSLVGAGCFCSDIYIVPMMVAGFAATFWEYFDYNQGAVAAGQQLGGDDFWTDGGRYLWHRKVPVNWCLQWMAKIEPRVILRTPHLAGKLLNVGYCPLQHTNEPYPDSAYFVSGGVTSRSGPSQLYSDWNQP